MSNLQIVITPDGRALDYNGEILPLPALATDAVVRVYDTPNGPWLGVQESGKPRPVYAGSGAVSRGRIELPADAGAVAEQEAAEARQRLTGVIQAHLDTAAKQRNYDGIVSLCTYATSTYQRFAGEGQAGVEWRDAVWALGYQLLDEVQSGAREIPSESELIAMLPEIKWPVTST